MRKLVEFKSGTFYETRNGIGFIPRENTEYEERDKWKILRNRISDYRLEKIGSHEDGRYCVAISVTELLNWMDEIENEKEESND